MTKTFRDQRLELGLTQQELAARCTQEGAPISDVALSNIERGVWSPRPRLRAVLCRILDLPNSYFDHHKQPQQAKQRRAVAS